MKLAILAAASVLAAGSVLGAFIMGAVRVITYPSPVVDVRYFGAVPNDSLDDSDALQKAWAACQHGDTLYLPPGTYCVSKPLVWTNSYTKTVDVSARHAVLQWQGTVGGTVLTYGGTGAPPVQNARFDGLTILHNRSSATYWDLDLTALAIQNLSDSEINLQWIDGFRRGVLFRGDDRGLTYSTIHFGVKSCKHSLSVEAGTPGWSNALVFDRCRFAGAGSVSPTNPPPYDSAVFIDIPPGLKHGGGNWAFRSCWWETNYAPYVSFNLNSCGTWRFDQCHFESRSQNPAGPHKMPFKVSKECGPIHIVGGVQNSLEIQAANTETVQILSNVGTVSHGTEPLRFRGKVTTK